MIYPDLLSTVCAESNLDTVNLSTLFLELRSRSPSSQESLGNLISVVHCLSCSSSSSTSSIRLGPLGWPQRSPQQWPLIYPEKYWLHFKVRKSSQLMGALSRAVGVPLVVDPCWWSVVLAESDGPTTRILDTGRHYLDHLDQGWWKDLLSEIKLPQPLILSELHQISGRQLVVFHHKWRNL